MTEFADAVADLVAAIVTARPLDAEPVTPADVMRAAGGLFPDRPVFAPAVPYRKD